MKIKQTQKMKNKIIKCIRSLFAPDQIFPHFRQNKPQNEHSVLLCSSIL